MIFLKNDGILMLMEQWFAALSRDLANLPILSLVLD